MPITTLLERVSTNINLKRGLFLIVLLIATLLWIWIREQLLTVLCWRTLPEHLFMVARTITDSLGMAYALCMMCIISKWHVTFHDLQSGRVA